MDIDQGTLTPESDFRKFIVEGIDTQVELFSWIGVDLEL
jgi:hypothetical protein